MTLRIGSANRDLMRRMNESSVFGIIHDHGPISRTDIAARSGLSLATISNITGVLIDQGIVIEQQAGASTGGRRPTLLAIRRDAAFAFGVKLTTEQIIVAITDLGARLVAQRAVPLGDEPTPEGMVARLGDVIDELRATDRTRKFVGLGLGMAGVIDRDAGVCRFSPFLPWRDVPLRGVLEERVAMGVIVENDVNALTVAERWFGAGAAARDFLVVTIGRGVGMGLVLNGELYRGGRDGAGEFGHVTVVEHGRRCNCGKEGCVEAYVSEPALAQAVRDATGTDIPFDTAIERAQSGDRNLAAIFADAGRVLGLALSGMVSVLNPTLLLLSGEGTRFVDLMLPALLDTLADQCFDRYFDDLEVRVQPWGDDAWARGAAALVLDDFFHPADLRLAGQSLAHGATRGHPLGREILTTR